MTPASVRTSTRLKVASVVISCAVQLGCGRGINMGCAFTSVIFNGRPPFFLHYKGNCAVADADAILDSPSAPSTTGSSIVTWCSCGERASWPIAEHDHTCLRERVQC